MSLRWGIRKQASSLGRERAWASASSEPSGEDCCPFVSIARVMGVLEEVDAMCANARTQDKCWSARAGMLREIVALDAPATSHAREPEAGVHEPLAAA